jgi:hypothetical protein
MDTSLPDAGPVNSLEVDDREWSERSLHWLHRVRNPKDKRVRRRPSRDPLILAGHGVSLRIEAGTLLVRNGFTHYPQKQESHRFFKGDANLPPRIIMLDGSGSMSFDVLAWLNEQKVPLVKIDWTGNAVTVISGDSFAADRERVAWQTAVRSDTRKRMEFCNALIAQKIEGCTKTLEADGYDPMLGIMHYDRDDAAAFVFDMMEPERPKVDHAVLAFLKSEALHPADFTIREDGVVRLNPELARRVAKLSSTDG